MPEIIYNEKSKKPDDDLLSNNLGTVFKYWQEIKIYTESLCGNTTEEWKYYGKNYGWQLKTLLKKRNLFFLIPYTAFFKIVFIFGDKAVDEIEQNAISDQINNDIINAKKYREGRGIAIEVKDGDYLPDIKMLLTIKMNN